MKSSLNRRSFFKRASLAVGAVSAAHVFPCPGILHAANADDKLNYAVIGCGTRGMVHLESTAQENLVAIVDVDDRRLAFVKKWLTEKGRNPEHVRTFSDYRRMFDAMAGQIDAVFVATPNHQHALPSMIAMQLGKGVYTEKPLCHDIAEARKLAEMARRYKVPTQMGNQGHCEEGYRKLCEYVWAGAFGKITETHSWTDRSNGGIGPRPATEPPPAGLHWEEWIGPAPYRDFHGDLHPHEWHGWYDFGNGSLGNMGCHVLDGIYWALKLEHPQTIEVEEMFGGSDERYPTATRIRWDLPPRGDMPALKAYWYDGRIGDCDPGNGAGGANGKKGHFNLPPMLVEYQKQFPDQKFDDSGTLYVGEKGIFYTSCYGQEMRSLPIDTLENMPLPPKSLPRSQDSFRDFLRACREGSNNTAAGFEYAARLTEFILLANIAQRAGAGKPVAWDGSAMKITNMPELNRWLQRDYREGWRIL
jgi:predicted dehydrogenase